MDAGLQPEQPIKQALKDPDLGLLLAWYPGVRYKPSVDMTRNSRLEKMLISTSVSDWPATK